MSDMKYCPECKQNRVVKPKINWILFVLLLFIMVLPALLYIVYCIIEKKQCVVCGCNDNYMKPYKPSE